MRSLRASSLQNNTLKKQQMAKYTRTIQTSAKKSAGQHLINAIRSQVDGCQYKVFASDIAFDNRILGRDLVMQLSGGRMANPAVDGKQVNIVTESGVKVRVFTRVLPLEPNSYGGYQRAVTNCEIAPINFAKEGDKPDVIVLVVFNPHVQSVDVFEYPLEEQEGKKVAKPSYSVRYAGPLKGYNKAEANLVASY